MNFLFSFVFIFFIGILNSFTILALSNFNVLDYGAKGDGKTDDSEAFLKAWNEVCGATEINPTLYVPEKTYMLKPLQFQGPCNSKQIQFQLKGTLVAPSKGAWPSDNKDRWIQFIDIDGLSVNGPGQFDGQGSSWWNDCHTNCKRPTALFFNHCNGLELSETKHINSGRNHISINVCNNVLISHIYITAPEDSPNTDGIDISQSTNIIIQDSVMATGDDCVAINNGTSNIDIVRVTCGPGHGISIGSLGKDGSYNVVENVHVSNCNIKGTQNGVRIKTWEGGYGYAKNITFEKITLENTKNPIIIDQYYTAFATARKSMGMNIKVSDVTYREIHGTSANEEAIILNCSKAHCSNIVMDNVDITTTKGQQAKSSCQNIDGKSESMVQPAVSCLSKSD